MTNRSWDSGCYNAAASTLMALTPVLIIFPVPVVFFREYLARPAALRSEAKLRKTQTEKVIRCARAGAVL